MSKLLKQLGCYLFKHRLKKRKSDGFIIEYCARCNKTFAMYKHKKPQPNCRNAIKPLIFDKSYWKGCKSKKAFDTAKEAKARMDIMRARPVTLGTYLCKWCDKWHLGNSESRVNVYNR